MSSSLRRSTRISAATTPAPDTGTGAKRSDGTTEPAKTSSSAARSEPKSKPRAPPKRKAPPPPPSPPPANPTPSTPLPKRTRRPNPSSASDPPAQIPYTPTPSAIALLSTTTTTVPTSTTPQTLAPRPAAPHATNAPLSIPNPTNSSPQLLTTTSPAKKSKLAPPDLRTSISLPTSNTATLLQDACAHLIAVDHRLRTLIEKHHCKMFSPEGLGEPVDPFTALASGIIGQQVSGQAAASIRQKFTSLFAAHPTFPTPAQVLEKDVPTLRTAGLSQRKAEYIHGLAEKFASGELSAEMLIRAPDDELIDRLVAVRGLGRWSVEMFACFGLKRTDVFSTGDLGVQRGMAIYMGKDVSKLKNKGGKWKYMTEKEMLDTAARFSPYRSLFMWYMWRISDVDISVLQD